MSLSLHVSYQSAKRRRPRFQRKRDVTAASHYAAIACEPALVHFQGSRSSIARAEKSDLTLQKLCDRLRSEKGVKADTSMMSRFFRRIGVTLKKRRSSRANKTGRTSAGIGRAGEPIRAASIPPASSLSTRPSGRARGQALGQNQHDPPLRLGAEGRAPHRQDPARPLGDRDLPRRFALRPHRRALPVRRPHQRRALSRLCRTGPRPDAKGRRCRDPRQSRLAQRQGRAEGDPRRRSSPRLPAEILPTSTRSNSSSPSSKPCCENSEREPTRPSPPPAAKSSNAFPQANAPPTSETQAMRKTKSKSL